MSKTITKSGVIKVKQKNDTFRYFHVILKFINTVHLIVVYEAIDTMQVPKTKSGNFFAFDLKRARHSCKKKLWVCVSVCKSISATDYFYLLITSCKYWREKHDLKNFISMLTKV